VDIQKLMENKMDKPSKNARYYNPMEKPTMYPLELTDDLHICLWDSKGEYKLTVAYWIDGEEGYDLHFVGDRPLDKRVDWQAFKSVVRQGQLIADNRFNEKDFT
jgi:hypothetical protein